MTLRSYNLRWDGIMEQIKTNVQESVSTLNQAQSIKLCVNRSNGFGGSIVSGLNAPMEIEESNIKKRILTRPKNLEILTNRPYNRVY